MSVRRTETTGEWYQNVADGARIALLYDPLGEMYGEPTT